MVENLPVNPIDTNNNINEVVVESLDTAEFVVFWKQFREAILTRNEEILSTMVTDSIDGVGFLFRDQNKNEGKVSKALFIDSLYVLFTPEFLSLLKSYEIEKYLGSNRENILWEKVEKKTYKSYVDFSYYQPNKRNADFYNVALYKMSWRRDKDYREDYVSSVRKEKELDFFTVGQIITDRDFERLDHLIFNLMFIKSSIGIKLNKVELSYILSISDS